MIEQTTEVDGLAHIYKQVAPGENIIKRGKAFVGNKRCSVKDKVTGRKSAY